MPSERMDVLLVGDSARNAPNLNEHLERRGCVLYFATSHKEAAELLKTRTFDFVFSKFMLSDGTALQLIPLLLGTETTMFFYKAVEDGCWWMHALFKGQDRSDEPGMRPREFRILLDQILYERRLQSPGKLPADEDEGSAAVSTGLRNGPSQR